MRLCLLLVLGSSLAVAVDEEVITYVSQPPAPVDLDEAVEERVSRTRPPTAAPTRAERTRVKRTRAPTLAPTKPPTNRATRARRTRAPTLAPTNPPTRARRSRTRQPTTFPTSAKRTRPPTSQPTFAAGTEIDQHDGSLLGKYDKTPAPTDFPTPPPTPVTHYPSPFPTKFPTPAPTFKGKVNCKEGSYYWGLFNHKHYCVLCDVGYTSKGCIGCLPDPKAKKCYGCPAGSYLEKQGDEECSECPVGKWQPKKGQSYCFACSPGFFNNQAGQSTCEECPLGKFMPGTTAMECYNCNKCEPGTYGTTETTAVKSVKGCVCANCPAGQFTPPPKKKKKNGGHMHCFHCSAGQYQIEEKSANCDNCPKGKFQSGVGQEVCMGCPALYTTRSIGAAAVDQCDKPDLHCNSGKFAVREDTPEGQQRDLFGRLFCLDCPEGKYGLPKGGGADACRTCPLGKFTADIGSRRCEYKHAVEIDSLAKLPCLKACSKHYGTSALKTREDVHKNRKLACDIGCSISATGFGKKSLGYGIGERPYKVMKCEHLPTAPWVAACLDGMQFSGGRPCSHLTCHKEHIKIEQHTEIGYSGGLKLFGGLLKVVETDRIVVNHHNKEEGGFHICRHSKSGECKCQCY